VELTSPVAARLLGAADGKVVGKDNLRAYFQRGLTAYPELNFKLEDVLWGLNSVVLYYTNQNGNRTAEFMELSAAGKVARGCGALQRVVVDSRCIRWCEFGCIREGWRASDGLMTILFFLHFNCVQLCFPIASGFRRCASTRLRTGLRMTGTWFIWGAGR
jgi:predicted ester cyclase